MLLKQQHRLRASLFPLKAKSLVRLCVTKGDAAKLRGEMPLRKERMGVCRACEQWRPIACSLMLLWGDEQVPPGKEFGSKQKRVQGNSDRELHINVQVQ